MKPTRPGLIGSIGTLLLLIIGLLLFYPHAPSSDTRSTERNPTIAIGIDLGSTYSRVAYGWDTRIVPDKNGNKFIPSCVSFTKDGFLIGDAARVWGIANPEATICNPKALLGKSWSDPDVQTLIKDLPYEVLSGHQDKPIIKVNVGGKGKSYTPEEVTSLIIGELKRMAEVTMGNNKTVTAAVMTVPMYYNDQQRQAIRDAARLAGLDVLRTQNESIAISVAYDMELGDDERNFIVVDIGDTLDVSVLNVDVGVLEVLATSHHDVGGNLFNRQIVNHLIETWKEKTGIDLAANPSSIRKLNLEVEKAKIARSSNETAIVDLRSIESTFVETLPNSEFEDVAEYLSMATMGAIRRNLQEAKLKFAEIDDIIITGGSGNIPKIHETVSRVFPHKTLYHGLGGDAVVIGAARTAALLSQPEDNHCGLRFTDSTPFDLGIETVDGFMATVVPRTFIPHRKSQNFTTAIDGQSTMLIRVLQGQRVLAADNLVIGEFELPLTPGPAGTPRVEVTFTVDGDLAIRVNATDLETNKSKSIMIGPDKGMWIEGDYELLDDTSKAFLDNLPQWNEAELRAQVEAHVDLECYLAALQGKMTDGEKWNVKDVRYSAPGRPIRLSELLSDIERVRGDLELPVGRWEPENLQKLKQAFTYRARPFVGELEYEVIRKVRGRSATQENELRRS